MLKYIIETIQVSEAMNTFESHMLASPALDESTRRKICPPWRKIWVLCRKNNILVHTDETTFTSARMDDMFWI